MDNFPRKKRSFVTHPIDGAIPVSYLWKNRDSTKKEKCFITGRTVGIPEGIVVHSSRKIGPSYKEWGLITSGIVDQSHKGEKDLSHGWSCGE
jgi:hypothetical protein